MNTSLVVKLSEQTEQPGYADLTENGAEQKESFLGEFCNLKKQRDEAKQALRAIADATVIESKLPGFQRLTYSDLLTRTDDEMRQFFETVQLNVSGLM